MSLNLNSERKHYHPYLDILRAGAIVGVIAIHVFDPLSQVLSGQNSAVNSILAALLSPTVPLFVMISGALNLHPEKNRNPNEFYSKRFYRVIIPLLFWSLFFALFINSAPIKDKIMQTLVFGQPFYLLYVLAALYFFTPYMAKIIQNLSLNEILTIIIASLALSSFASFFEHWLLVDHNILPHFSFTLFLYYFGYYCLGFYLHRFNSKSLSSIPFALVILALLILVENIGFTLFGNSGKTTYWVSHFSPLVIVLSAIVFTLAKNHFQMPSLNKLVRYISRESFALYFLHMLILFYMGPFFSHSLPAGFLGTVMTFSITMIASLGLGWVFKKIPGGKYLVGS